MSRPGLKLTQALFEKASTTMPGSYGLTPADPKIWKAVAFMVLVQLSMTDVPFKNKVNVKTVGSPHTI